MRLPALAIAIAFSLGIACGLSPVIPTSSQSARFLTIVFVATVLLILAALVLALRQFLRTAGLFSLAAWFLLGITAATISSEPRPANYIVNLTEAGTIDLHSPLRWHGTLRDEPELLPWGTSIEIVLTAVDYQERNIPVQGGMRLTYSAHPNEPALPEIHFGDEVEVVAHARLPQLFRDEGAFDRRAYLRSQGVDLTAALRSPELLQLIASSKASPRRTLARIRGDFRESLSALLPAAPQEVAVLRAMLLGDRSFLDRTESVNFQKTGVFHVLVVAGLHVGAFAAFLFWTARRLRLSRTWTSLAVVLCVLAYVAVVEQRPPVLRAALMTLLVILTILFFRRVELLNSVAIAALILLVASPALLADSSFQLSFLSMFCIAGLAAPWLEKSIEPYARGMRGWRDVTRDVSHQPRVAQFRIDLRSIVSWLEPKLPAAIATGSTEFSARVLSLGLRISEMVVLTIVLQIGMLPLLARDFHRVTLSGPLANLVAVPLTGIIVPLGFAVLIAGVFSHAAALFLAIPLRWLTALLLHSVDWIAHLPRWSYRIPSPPLWLVCVFFFFAVILSIALRLASDSATYTKRFAFACVLICAVLIAIFPFAPSWRHGSLEFTTLDVGQGDSLFLVSPGGNTILVDGGGSFIEPYRTAEARGPDPGEDVVSPYLWLRGFKQIDVVALTHAHQDHLGGLTAVLENFKVKTLWIGREVDSVPQRQLEALARSRGVNIAHELRGNQFDLYDAHFQFLWPRAVPEEIAPSAKNDDSLVFRLAFGERALLLPGDAEKSAEHSILAGADRDGLRADVLKIGHHGSKNSTTPEFLAAVQPRVAVISAGEENPYGHPSPLLLERLNQAGVPYLRTDTSGAIHVFTDGKIIEVNCFVACPGISAQLNSPRAQAPDHQQSGQQ